MFQRAAQHVLKGSTLLEYLLQFWMFFAELIKTILLLLHVREKSTHFQLLWVQSFLNFLSYTDIVLLLVNGRDFGLHLSLQDQSNIKGLTHVAEHHAAAHTLQYDVDLTAATRDIADDSVPSAVYDPPI